MGFVRRGFGALIAIVIALWCAPAIAHPLGNFTINHLVKVRQSGNRLEIRYVLDMAEIPTFSVMRARSANATLDKAELQAWAGDETRVVIDGLDVESGSRRIALEPLGVPTVRTRPGAGGLPTLYYASDFSVTPPSSDVTINDQTYPDRIGWKDVVVSPATEPTAELTHYPTALLASPRDVTAASLSRAQDGRWALSQGSADRAAASSQAGASQAGVSQLRSNVLADMLARGPSSALVIALTLLAAIGLGALHALEPGHGKTLLAVSLVGARATPKQAVTLAAALTIAHTAGVIALGLALLFAARWIVPENVYPWLTAVSGLVVVCLGAAALARYMRARYHAASGHDHRGDHDHSHAEGKAHGHSHAIPGDAPLSFGNVVLIAMSGNIAPCPAALVVMLAALALHQVAYGIVIIVAFGMGLAAVLTGLGLALVRGTAWIARSRTAERFMAYGPVVSACVISVIGAIMLGQGIAGGIIRVQPWAVIALTLSAIAGYALHEACGHTHRHEGSHA